MWVRPDVCPSPSSQLFKLRSSQLYFLKRLKVKFLLKTDSGYSKDATPWQLPCPINSITVDESLWEMRFCVCIYVCVLGVCL